VGHVACMEDRTGASRILA